MFNNTNISPVELNPNQLLQKVDKKNLLSLPSILIMSFFIFSTIFIDLNESLMDGKIDLREGLKISYLLLGAVCTVLGRGIEKPTITYTPHGLPGLDKEQLDSNI